MKNPKNEKEPLDTPIKDDSHERWGNQSDTDNTIWNYYNEVVAKNVVVESIHTKGITLIDLYQKVALKRAECEWVKQYVSNNGIKDISPAKIEEILKNNIHFSFPDKFANFMAGNSQEPNILSWGEAIINLVVKRQDKNCTGTIGLSVVCPSKGRDQNYDLRHPQGYVLARLENDFQAMLNTTNLFEFLKITSRLTYLLSNYPPIERGSAAVNSWIVDLIAQEKFNVTSSIRPFLYDWTAFFDTPEKYTQYNVMSSVVNYIKSLHKIDGINEFETKLLNLMQENPHILNNALARESIWNELKNIMSQVNKNDFSESEMKHFNEIVSGDLVFRKPITKFEKIIEIISTHETSKAIALLSTTDKDYLTEIFSLNYYIGQVYLSQYGTDTEENFHSMVTDLLFLQNNVDKDKIDDFSYELVFKQGSNRFLKEYEQKTKEFEDMNKELILNPIYRWGFIGIDTMHSFSKLIKLSKGLEEKVALALKNGMQLTALNTFVINNEVTSKDIEILTSKAAILLYKKIPTISFDSLIMKTSEETEMHLLELVAKHYCNEHIEKITNEDIRNCLLTHLDPCLFTHVTLSELVGKTEYETKTKLLSAYLNHSMPDMENVKKIIATLQKDIDNQQFLKANTHNFFSTKSSPKTSLDIIQQDVNLANIEYEIEIEGDFQGNSNLSLSRDMAEHVKMLTNYCNNAYELLDVNQDASTTEITKAFYKQARIHHPDKNVHSDKELMQYIVIAHKVLIDPVGREAYDQALAFKNTCGFK